MTNTGIFLRVEREGQWQSLDLGELSAKEIEKTFAERTDTYRFLIAVIERLQELDSLLNISSEEKTI